MRALVVGYGSVGERHTRLLAEMGCEVAVVSLRPAVAEKQFVSIAEAVAIHDPGYVVIANRTSEHHVSLRKLAEADFCGDVLVEKPLFAEPRDLPHNCFRNCFVAYQLRFHPVISRLKSLLEGQHAVSVLAYVGQYLPSWRPARDYRAVYSAHDLQGGGVLRDLSHELDILLWIFGAWKRLVASGGHYSSLEISSADVFSIMFNAERCPLITVRLDYLLQPAQRKILVATNDKTIEADLVERTVTVNGLSETFPVDHDSAFRSLHRAILTGDHAGLCCTGEGMEVVSMINAAEESVRRGEWIAR